MPLPEKKNDESTKEFIARCMGDDVMKREYGDSGKRYAVCVRLSGDGEHNATYEQFYGEAGYREKETFDLDTSDIPEVDLMGPGTWNGIPFKKEDLLEVVSNFSKLKDRVKAWLALGHSGKLGTRQRSGMPAVGWIDRLWWDEKTERLKGSFTDVPKKLAELIKAKAYRRVSVEYIRNFLDAATGKRYNRVMVGCALLGTELPAVTTNRTLDQVRALYMGDEYEHEVIEWFENSKGGDEMDELETLKANLATAKESLKKAETFIKKVLEKFGDCDQDELLSGIDSLVKERDEFKAKIEKNEAEIKEGKIDALFTKASGKLLPKEEEMYREMLKGVEGIEKLDDKIKELTEMFEAKESLKKKESAEHDNTGEDFRHDHGRGKKDEEDIKDAEEAEEFVSDIEHELKEKGITDALGKEDKEEFTKQYQKTETT